MDGVLAKRCFFSLPTSEQDKSFMELKLSSLPAIKDQLAFICHKMINDDFEYLCNAGLASPSSPDEYRSALQRLLKDKKLTNIPDKAYDDAYIFQANGACKTYTIDLQLYVEGRPSDIFGIFHSRIIDTPSEVVVHLYDILVP